MSIQKLPPLPLVDGCLFIDNSAWMEGMATCPRSLQYKSLNQRIAAGEKASLNFGSALHLALELRYALYGNKSVDEAYYASVADVLTEQFNQHPIPTDDWRNLNWAMEVVKRYNDRYPMEEFGLLQYDTPIKCPVCDGKPSEVSASLLGNVTYQTCKFCRGSGTRTNMIELPFALPLFTWRPNVSNSLLDASLFVDKCLTEEQRPWYHKHNGIPIMYSGKIDLPTHLDGGIWVNDHKTTGMLGDMFWNQMRMTSQQRGYVWAFQQLTDKPVKGYVINAIRTKEPPQYVMAGKSFKGKSQTPEAWFNESFQRERYHIKPGEIEGWEKNTIDLVEEFMWHYSRDFMPQKTSWCSSYGRCQYFSVCELDSQDRGAFLQSGLFMNNEWSPLNKIKTQAKQ